MGALDDLTFPGNFEQISGITPDAAAAAFAAMYDAIEDCSMIGQIVAYATSNPPTGTLACDGASFLRAAYPALYAAIDPAYHIDADHARTPDLRGRGIVGAGAGGGLTNRTIAQSFGEEAHTLITSELAAHNHPDAGHIHGMAIAFGAVTAGAGVPVPIAYGVPTPASTTFSASAANASAGGDDAHNNMPPSHVLNYAIYYI